MTAPASHLAIAAALGVAVFTVATAVPVASAQVLDKEVHIDAIRLRAATRYREDRHDRDLDQ